ncbi:HNH endonuclease [Arenimonas caeni]|uniref:HNH endonuclease n=1 Tax=Arenimonas caeni TaxID=2058085 RepID=A0A2P6M7E8_9GAMM|nr:HNH endonuclease [Arenimonas caeni]PRH81908.1 HNH endonuclease [Arenimonas caeni]
MRYWWVNQNQTYAHEVGGNYLWSPKVNANGNRNPFYEFMREVAPGDVVFSFCDTRIRAIGIARSHAYEAPKPLEFQNAGAYWNKVGWRVDVGFVELMVQPRPADHMELIGKVLPEKYAPLQFNGKGLQGVYLTEVTEAFANVLLGLMDQAARNLVRASFQQDAAGLRADAVGLVEWEAHQIAEVQNNKSIPETDRLAVILARRGQGKFKENVLKREHRCRITLVDRIEHLRASHCKPWRDASNSERLDGENGLLLTPSMDHLFDRGFISFKDNGDVLVSPVAHKPSLGKMGLATDTKINVGSFTSMQKKYLEFHRNFVFLESRNRN